MRLAPSILAADLADLAGALDACAEGGADLVHFDVMDGRFVPNLSFGLPVLEAVRRRTELPIDVHLMVEEPSRLLARYLDLGPQRVAVHHEAEVHLDRALATIREADIEAGVAINPATPPDVLVDVLHGLDFVLLMSVNPGFAGQRFLPHVLDKARRLRAFAEERGVEIEIEIDGGVGAGNIADVAAAGVDTAVAGSAVFAAHDPAEAIRALRRAASASTASVSRASDV
ncbi:MAG: ribulose-phosphate 3-epimerase [Acidobacteriota bacterium]